MMTYLGKLLPVLVMPLGLAIVLVLVSLVRRRRGPAVAAVILLWLSSTPLVSNTLMRATEGGILPRRVADVPPAAAIVVLSGMVSWPPAATDVPEWGGAVERYLAGVALVRADKAPALVFTGGWRPGHSGGESEGDVLVARATADGVPRARIRLTGWVETTSQEARAVAALLPSTGPAMRARSIILVTSAYHMRRAVVLFERAGLTVDPFPVDFQVAGGAPTWLDAIPAGSALANTERAIREWYGYAFYRFAPAPAVAVR
jgi:uncharacterized SAM-binding protein YcdF (DUF218 family)